MISRDGQPTPLGHAVAHFGRIFKTLHVLRLADDEPYRREIKAQANLTEGRHDLARRIFHGRKGENDPGLLRRDGRSALRTRPGAELRGAMEHRLHGPRPERAARPDISGTRCADAARLSPFVRSHIGIDGLYRFHLPTSGGHTAHCATRTPRTAPSTTDVGHRRCGRGWGNAVTGRVRSARTR